MDGVESGLELRSVHLSARPHPHTATCMTSHSYEIALFGEFLKGDLKPVLNRIALHSESAHQMHSYEVIFDPPDAAIQREANQEPALLRAKKELLEPDAKWLRPTLPEQSGHLLNISTQAAIFILETRVCSYPPRGYCPPVGNCPGGGGCSRLRLCFGLHVRALS